MSDVKNKVTFDDVDIIITTLAEAKEIGEEQLGLPTENEEIVVRFRADGTTDVCIEAKQQEIK